MDRETTCGVCCGAGACIAGCAFLLWLGLPPLMGVVSFLGLRVSPVDLVLLPVVAVALGLVSGGLWLATKSHGRGEPFMVSLVGAAATIVGMMASPAVATLGVLTVAGSIAWNQLIGRGHSHVHNLR